MRSVFFFIICFIAAFINVYGQSERLDYKLKGKIKTLTETEYEVDGKSKILKKGKQLNKFHSKYNNKGDVMEAIGYDAKGNIPTRVGN